jgi:hypothetical protein
MAGFVKILMTGDAAVLSDDDAHDIGTTAAEGVATDASRHDHVHVVGSGAINNANMFAASVVDAAAIGSNAVAASEIDETATDITFAQIVLATTDTPVGTTAGTLYFDTSEGHLKVYVP